MGGWRGALWQAQVLGVSTSLSEAEVHWRDFLRSLIQRGLEKVKRVTSDSREGLKATLRAVLSGIAWQRCQFHLQQNPGSYVPRVEMSEKAAIDIRAVFNARDRHEADRLLEKAVKSDHKTAPKRSLWMEGKLPEGLTLFSLPINRRRRPGTSNLLERVNREL